MQLTWLGWAGVELEFGGASVVIDPLADAAAVFAPFGERGALTPLPAVAPAAPSRAVAGLLTHLHRDHADAAALLAALAPGAPVLEPQPLGGSDLENLGLTQADRELSVAGFERRPMAVWETAQVGPFQVTALPSADGLGDPQVAWLVEAGGARVLHLGDTMTHGSWWRMALRHGPFDVVLVPVNGAVLRFPHRRPSNPAPGVLDPHQAASAVSILGARLAIPIHFDGYEIDGIYQPVEGAARRFISAASDLDINTHLATPGDTMTIPTSAQASSRNSLS